VPSLKLGTWQHLKMVPLHRAREGGDVPTTEVVRSFSMQTHPSFDELQLRAAVLAQRTGVVRPAELLLAALETVDPSFDALKPAVIAVGASADISDDAQAKGRQGVTFSHASRSATQASIEWARSRREEPGGAHMLGVLITQADPSVTSLLNSAAVSNRAILELTGLPDPGPVPSIFEPCVPAVSPAVARSCRLGVRQRFYHGASKLVGRVRSGH
jgi:hypothetical protein